MCTLILKLVRYVHPVMGFPQRCGTPIPSVSEVLSLSMRGDSIKSLGQSWGVVPKYALKQCLTHEFYLMNRDLWPARSAYRPVDGYHCTCTFGPDLSTRVLKLLCYLRPVRRFLEQSRRSREVQNSFFSPIYTPDIPCAGSWSLLPC